MMCKRKRTIGFKSLPLLLAAVLITGCASTGGGQPSEAHEEAEGKEERLVVTSVSICQITDRLDLDLAGVPQTSSGLPERYRETTTVGYPMSPDLEIIRSLKPTKVISPNSLQYELSPSYEGAGLEGLFLNLLSVEGMYDGIDLLGDMFDRQEEAAEMRREFEAAAAEWKALREGKEAPRVLILMGLPGSYMVATEQSYVGNLVKLAGGINVFAGDGALLNVNTEAIAQTEPDIILRAAHGMPEEVVSYFGKEFEQNDIWRHFTAVQENRVFDLPHTLFNMSADLGYPDAVKELNYLFYGDGKE